MCLPASEDLKEPSPEEARPPGREARVPRTAGGERQLPRGSKGEPGCPLGILQPGVGRGGLSARRGREKRFRHVKTWSPSGLGRGRGCALGGMSQPFFPWQTRGSGASANTPPGPAGAFPLGPEERGAKGPRGAHRARLAPAAGRAGTALRAGGCSGQRVPGRG